MSQPDTNAGAQPVSDTVPSPQAQESAPGKPTDGSTADVPTVAPAPPKAPTQTVRIPGDVLRKVTAMGFTEISVKKAFICGCIDEGTCVQWITMQLDDPQLNTPITDDVEVIVVEKRVLTQEEQAQKIAELKEKIAAKKNKDLEQEKQSSVENEKKRIEMAKNMREAKEQRDAYLRQQMYEQQRKEKLQDAKAKEKILVEIAVDKLRRQGMDENAARAKVLADMEEKKQSIQAKAQAEDSERAATMPPPSDAKPKPWVLHVEGSPADTAGNLSQYDESSFAVTYPVTLESFLSCVSDLRAGCPDFARASACLNTLLQILKNISEAPLNPKFRQLRRTGSTYMTRIGAVQHAERFLRLAGFTSDSSTPENLEMKSVVICKLQKAIQALTQAGAT